MRTTAGKLLLSISLLASVSALAQQAGAGEAAAAAGDRSEATARAQEERLVCQRVKKIGSNRIERVCKTEAQSQKESEEAALRAARRDMQRTF
ncbi:hypothetical protein [Vulcaniibacterium tengchongense]|uniref:PsiF repeat-containing protein n=1 Tax=Vulcaniibacterium tengchongense TaxID=1273429 RepID=A0A3N4V9M7_9GAMM|nr:hypothetical protein [Vulcaniibacterium tengchongense]RPE79696.1 hypothetical protein EDC50_1520 [Vulcaniibacterium tengchongense]